MRAVSLLQPWASLVIKGHKRIETPPCRACRTPMDPLDRDACARCGAPYHLGCLVPCDGCGARVGGCCGWGVCCGG